MYDSNFTNELNVKIDEVLKNPNTSIKLDGKNITVEEFRKMEKSTGLADYNDEKYRTVVYWDDIVQYTPLGLLSYYVDKFKLDSKLLSIHKYLNRPEVDALNYVSRVSGIQIEQVKKDFRDNYENLLLISPMSGIMEHLIYMRHTLDSIIFIFSHNYESNKDLIDDIQEDSLKEVNIASFISERKPFYDFMDELSYDIVYCYNMGEVLESLFRKEILDVSVAGPFDPSQDRVLLRNGLNAEYIAFHFFTAKTFTLNNIELIFFHEKVAGWELALEEQRKMKKSEELYKKEVKNED